MKPVSSSSLIPVNIEQTPEVLYTLQPDAIAMSCLETLREKGFKLTPQRRLIVDIIHDTHSHLTADEIIGYVQERLPGVNKSTIYRTLEILENLDCVYKSESGDRFIYHHAEEGHHHHLVCTKCGKTVECSENLFSGVKQSLEKKYGFTADFKHLVINGVCDSCGKNSS
jgi:Fur family transcriptional regulator, ferric uptake regulator